MCHGSPRRAAPNQPRALPKSGSGPGASKRIEPCRKPARSEGAVQSIHHTFATAVLRRPVRFTCRHSCYAPYLPSRPALARASGIRYLASKCPKPPRMQWLFAELGSASGRQQSDTSSVGTGCQLWLFS